MPTRCRSLALLLIMLTLWPVAGCTRSAPGQVTDLTLTDRIDVAGRPVRALGSFSVSAETIYAVAVVSGANPGSRLQARWYLSGKLVQESPPLALPDSDARYVDFSLYRRGATFPAGSYRVEILLDGRSLRSAEFTIM